MPKLATSCLGLAVVAVGLAVQPALAQGGPEGVEVTAPHFRNDTTHLNGPIERVSLTTLVHYEDLNLRTRQGASTLRWRVTQEARNVCERLGQAYPVYELSGTSCYRTALENALLRADAAIRYARDERRYSD